jgi:hypothetical protein
VVELAARALSVGVFFEFGPAVAVSPGYGGDLQAGVGVRYYF